MAEKKKATRKKKKPASSVKKKPRKSGTKKKSGLSAAKPAMSDSFDFSRNTAIALLESEERYKNLFASIRDVIIIADNKRIITNANQPALRELFGYELDEIVGRKTQMLYANEKDYKHAGKEIFDKDQKVSGKIMELDLKRKDGTVFSGELYAMKLLNIDGLPTGNIGIIRDITPRKTAEKKQFHLQQRLEAQWELASMVDADITAISDHILEEIVRLSGSKYGFYGFLNKDESIMTTHSWSVNIMKDCAIHDKPLEFNIEQSGVWGNAIRERKILIINDFTKEYPNKKGLPEGHVAITRLMVIPVFRDNRIVAVGAVANKASDYTEEDSDQVNSFMQSARLIQEKKKIETELEIHHKHLNELVKERTSELQREIAERRLIGEELKHMALFAKLNPSPVIRFDYNGNILMANPAANEIFGREDLYETSLQSLIPEVEDFNFASCIKNGSIISHTIKIGEQFFHLVFKGISDLNVGHIYGSDITERIEAEKEMQLMALFAELNPAPVIRFDTEGKVLMANPAANDIFHSNDITGVTLESIIPGIEDITFSECIMGNMILSHPAQIMDRYFHFIIMGISFLKIGHIYGIDITESKRAETETLHVSHLASIGELAAGVAHEINNPINGIINYAQLLTNKCPQGSDEKDIAARIIKEGDRISVIVKNLLSFARVTQEEKSPSQIRQIFSDTFALTEAQLLKDNIILHVNIPEGLPDIIAHPQQIEQVFLNLLSNARYALNEKYPNTDKNKILEISTDTITINNKPFLHITFYDHGTGIPYGLVDKVMNPFFSTKSTEMGTGLGLSISHGIITDHGGKIRIDSVDGEYTSIILDIPVYNKGQIS